MSFSTLRTCGAGDYHGDNEDDETTSIFFFAEIMSSQPAIPTARRGDPDFTSELNDADFDVRLNRVRAMLVIGMIFGLLGCLSIPLGLVYFHQGSILGDLEIRLRDETLHSPSIDSMWFFISTTIGTGLSVILFICSVVAMRFQSAGRIGLLFFAIAGLLFPYLGWVFVARWIIPASAIHTAQVRGTVPSYANIVGSVVGVLLAIAFFVALLRQSVARAFTSSPD